VNEKPWCKLLSTLAQIGVAVRREDEVRDYLDSHADLLTPVEEVCRSARQEFGPDASLALEVYRDTEIEDEYLTLYVRLPSYPPDTLRKIRSVSEAHEQLLEDKSGTLLVTTDFCPTR
jgi:hypothetical protein